jgi:MFS family permease
VVVASSPTYPKHNGPFGAGKQPVDVLVRIAAPWTLRVCSIPAALLLLMLLLQVHGSPEAAEAAKQLPTWRQLPTILAAALQSRALLYFSGLGFLWMFCMSSLFSWLPLLVANIQTGTALSHSSMGHATVLATRNSTSAHGSAAVQDASAAAAEAAAAASRQITQALLASTVPYIGAAAATVLVAWLASGHKLNRRAGSSSGSSSSSKVAAPQPQQHTKMFHVAVPLLAGAVPLLCFTPAYNAHPGAGFTMLCIALTAGFAANSTMIAEASRTVPPSTAGIGLTVFNLSVAMGGLAGPAVIGVLVQATGGFHWAVVLVGLVMAVAAAVAGARGVWELLGCGQDCATVTAAAAAPSIEAGIDVEAPSDPGIDAGAMRVAVKF